jgi:isoaspartyl peptidase/L-asparaginase-like protein (Ntn-hydrolase superfamily)
LRSTIRFFTIIDQKLTTSQSRMKKNLAIATWKFGLAAAEKATAVLEAGGSALDAVVAGAQAVEDDPSVNSVGYGGIANAWGSVQVDACVMRGKDLCCGGVASVENIRHAAALARLVMEKTRHVLLVGEGAKLFAVAQGFSLESLHTPESIAEWQRRYALRQLSSERRQESDLPAEWNHDTVTVLARDRQGDLAGVCTTSGLAFKLPGRVGDSPLIGHGLYVDNEVGAAGATGAGEEIIRVGGSLVIIEAMRAGRGPQAACELVVGRVNALAQRRGEPPAHVAFMAMDTSGSIGCASTKGANFSCAVARPGKAELIRGREIGPSA